ncbi:MAG TPA: hypothetical protein VM911_00920 [Pyrinomonadaceae bacterium]|nr:hypothetical protein [Pyrinomonadaceae bacterium]
MKSRKSSRAEELAEDFYTSVTPCCAAALHTDSVLRRFPYRIRL